MTLWLLLIPVTWLAISALALAVFVAARMLRRSEPHVHSWQHMDDLHKMCMSCNRIERTL